MRKVNSIALLILSVFIIATARASYTIWSNSIIVQSNEITLTLASDYVSALPRYSTVHLTATLKFGGFPAPEETVILYMNGTQVSSFITNSEGKALFNYVLDAPGLASYNFTCGYEVP